MYNFKVALMLLDSCQEENLLSCLDSVRGLLLAEVRGERTPVSGPTGRPPQRRSRGPAAIALTRPPAARTDHHGDDPGPAERPPAPTLLPASQLSSRRFVGLPGRRARPASPDDCTSSRGS